MPKSTLGLGALEKWDITNTSKFLKLYRQHKCLWDHTDTNYKDKRQRTAALSEISKSMGLPGFDTRYVVLKIRALRSTYIYERRKVRQRLKNGEKFQTHLGWYHLADSFLRNYVVEKTFTVINENPNKDLPPPVYLTQELNPNSTKIEFYRNHDNESHQNPSELEYVLEEEELIEQQTEEAEDQDTGHEYKPLLIEQQQLQQQSQQQCIIPVTTATMPESIQLEYTNSMKLSKQNNMNQNKNRIKNVSITGTTNASCSTNETEQQLLQQSMVNIINPPPMMTTNNTTTVAGASVADSIIDKKSTLCLTDANKMEQSDSFSCSGGADITTNTANFITPNSTPNDTNNSLMAAINNNNSSNNNIANINNNNNNSNTSLLIHETENNNDVDEFEAFAKSIAVQLRKIPIEEVYSLQIQFQYLLSQAKLKAMGKIPSIVLRDV